MSVWNGENTELDEVGSRTTQSQAHSYHIHPDIWISLLAGLLFLVCVGIVYGISQYINSGKELSNAEAGSTGVAFSVPQQAETLIPQENLSPQQAATLTSTATQPPTPTGKPTATPFSEPPISWNIQIVDLSPKSGLFTSLVADGSGGQYVAYFNDEFDSLRLATLNKGLWNYVTLAVGKREGFYPSIAIDSQGILHMSQYTLDTRQVVYGSATNNGWRWVTVAENVTAVDTSLVFDQNDRPHIDYFDADSGAVQCAVRTTNGWIRREVGKGSPDGVTVPIAIDLQNQPHVAYYSGSDGLVYASLNGEAWERQIVDPGAGVGLYPSLAFDAAGSPHLSYYDENKQALKHAVWDGQQWQISVVDSQGNAGKFSSIAIDTKGRVHITYYRESVPALKYAYGSGTTWNVSIVDAKGDVGKYNSMYLDKDGNPHISYWAMYDQRFPVLKYAYRKIRSDATSNASELTAFHRSGQTFITWPERNELQRERYRIYRYSQPIQSTNLKQATLLAEVGKDSSRFYANRFNPDNAGRWTARYVDRLIIQDNGSQVSQGTGLLVWTLAAEDFQGGTQGQGYYAVTVIPYEGQEVLDPRYTVGPVEEAAADPLPVEITSAPGVNIGPGGRVYIQYMDLRHWNPTFHTPNQSNAYYGLDPADPTWSTSLAYAYDYAVYTPTPELCGGSLPENLPVFLHLHGWLSNSYWPWESYGDPGCVYGIYPWDETETWHFGFASQHDYRQNLDVSTGDTIENFTEYRILRMIYDLIRQPPGPPTDTQRIYVAGQSMGGSGTLAFTSRFPNIFAAGYASQPMTNYLIAGITRVDWIADVAIKWGKLSLNLPVKISAPAGWAAHLQKYNGTGVYDWQDYLANISGKRVADEIAPIGVANGMKDMIVLWSTQGQPTCPALDQGRRAWAGAITNSPHQWEYYNGLPVPLGVINQQPFWNFSVIRDESVPGFSNLSSNPPLPPTALGQYNHTIKWSSSWNAWDGAPIDQADMWQISLCSLASGSLACGTGPQQTVDVTPRRLQHFVTVPGASYNWQDIRISDGMVIAEDTVTADSQGLVTVTGFVVSPRGSRLALRPHK
jgi:hypothetical protein